MLLYYNMTHLLVICFLPMYVISLIVVRLVMGIIMVIVVIIVVVEIDVTLNSAHLILSLFKINDKIWHSSI